MSDEREGDATPLTSYYYRRPLGPRDLLPVLGIAGGAAAAAFAVTFYVARLFVQRTPLLPVEAPPRLPRKRRGR